MKTERTLALAALLLIVCGCKSRMPTRNRLNEKQFPSIVLWAWERPEDLQSLDAHQYAVAFLAQTLRLKGDEVVFSPRHQPLEVPPEIKLIAVTRLESQKVTGQRAALSPVQREQIVRLIVKTLELSRVTAIQVDFDATASERDFYRSLLQDLRAKLPDEVPLSMTALASFCIGDRWLTDLPVDEAVPMIFRMGADERSIRNLLSAGNDFGEPLCRRSYGISVDEPIAMKFEKSRRVYVFNDRPWSDKDIASLSQRIRQ